MNTSPLWHILCRPNYHAIRHRILRALPVHSLWALAVVENSVIFDAWPNDDFVPTLFNAAYAIAECEHSNHKALRRLILHKVRRYDTSEITDILDTAMANNCPYPVLHDIWTIGMSNAARQYHVELLASKDHLVLDGKTGHDYANVVDFVWQDVMLWQTYEPRLEFDLIWWNIRKFIAAGCNLPKITMFIEAVQKHIRPRYGECMVELYEHAIASHAMPLAAELFATLDTDDRLTVTSTNAELWESCMSDTVDEFQCHDSQIIPLLQHMVRHHGNNCPLKKFWLILEYTHERIPFTPEVCTFLASLYNAPSAHVNDDEFEVLAFELYIIIFKHTNDANSVRFYFVRDYLPMVLQRFSVHPLFSQWVGRIDSAHINMLAIRADWNI